MNSAISTALVDLLEASEETALALQLKDLATSMGFAQFALHAEINRPFFGQIQHAISNHAPEWQRLYQERNYLAIDPTVLHCRTRTEFCIWNEALGGEATSEFWGQVKKYCMLHTVSVPVHSRTGLFSMLSLTREQPLQLDATETTHALNLARVLARCAHGVVLRILSARLLIQHNPQLSPREKECMHWVAHGKTAFEIAKILCLAEATVTFHVSKAIHKLGAQNRSQAIAISVALGLLD